MAKLIRNNKVGKTGAKKKPDKKTRTEKTPDTKTAVKKRKSGGKRKSSQKITQKPTVEKLELDYVDDDGLVHEGDENIPSEDEEDVGDERKHQKLLEAISALGGKNKRKLAERSEATLQISEFTVDAKGEGDRINMSDLIQTISKTPAVSSQTKSHLKKLKLNEKTVDSPLSKPETQRIQRNVAFQKTSEQVSRWQSIVKQNLKAEQLVFPLNQEAPGPKPLEHVVCGWTARTPLEQEIFALLFANKQPIHNTTRTPMEEESLKAMSLEDAKIRRAELQKARALQSYYEAKARREKSIKSKKYHKVQNKAKCKDFVKQFDEMVKSDPVAALEELQKLELGRMKERMSLKHQNSGKWAKSKAIMAKYDLGARKAMQQQLEVNKDLTQKLAATLEDEQEEREEEADPDMLPDFVNDVEPPLNPDNPWMRGKLSREAGAETGDSAEPAARDILIEEEEEEEEEETEETEEEVLLRGFAARRSQRRAMETVNEPVTSGDMETVNEPVTSGDMETVNEPVTSGDMETEATTEENKAEAEKVAVSDDDDDDDQEEELSKFTNLFQELAESRKEADAAAVEAEVCDPEAEQLQQALFRIQNLEDMDLLDRDEQGPPAEPGSAEPPPAAQESEGGNTGRKRKRGIDLNEVLTKEAKVIQVPLAPRAVEDAEGAAASVEEEQRDIIKEAFAGDDVVSDFLRDKRRDEDAGKPKVLDLTLPGWGDWGGLGVQPPRRKRRRFRVRTAPPPPRKDRALASVIISEKRDRSVSMHQVGALPHPFVQPEHFEVTMRTPVGATWNTRQTVRKITMPKVVTKMGAIIQPMSRDDLLKHTKRREADGTSAAAQKQKDASQNKRPNRRPRNNKKKHKKN
ncbi:hypothetical protein NHX12_007078 [Muraenolepis orangiensis]|uniref:UTP14C small subunit processome component n=1 Tax=Muraenolepis orangiensis TaxID=630683 RepID=A0A9Q0DQW7_9TELE|nr:hypothetical protein NHX12_007078 [Muraenolepis orangiensis]